MGVEPNLCTREGGHYQRRGDMRAIQVVHFVNTSKKCALCNTLDTEIEKNPAKTHYPAKYSV